MSAAPNLRLLPSPRERPTIRTLRHLYQLQMDLEIRWSEGPWDRWDGELLEKWRTDVRAAINQVEGELEYQLEMDIRACFTAALSSQLFVHLTAAEIRSADFERFVAAMEAVR